MAKIIKRVGIVFFVLVISFLVVLSMTLNVETESNKFTLLKDNNEINDIEQQPIIDEEVFLNGKNSEEQAKIWVEIITKSLAGKHILATLTEDWNGNNSNAFADSSIGFNNGSIVVEKGTIITLDLNGHKIDRKLSAPIVNGNNIVVKGELILKDSKYDSKNVLDLYNANYNEDLYLLVQGGITGGYSNNCAGGIVVDGGTFIMNGGMIYGNNNETEDEYYGGGISAFNGATIIINDGLITKNESNIGGGIFAMQFSRFEINGGLIFKNRAAINSGGVSANSLNDLDMTGGIISNNWADSIGGISYTSDGTGSFNIYGGRVEYNYVYTYGGGGVSINLANFNMYNGYICNNQVRQYDGGGCYFSDTNVKIYGGEISGNIAGYKNNNGKQFQGGGIFVSGGGNLELYDGKITKNECGTLGAGIAFSNFSSNSTSKATIYGGEISENIGESGCGIYSNIANHLTLKGGLIINNIGTGGGYGLGIYFNGEIDLYAGVQIYGNHSVGGVVSNVQVLDSSSSKAKLNVKENLMNNGKTTYIGVTAIYIAGEVTINYSETNVEPPSRFFFSDARRGIVLVDNEAYISSNNRPTFATINWKWGDLSDENSSGSNVILPYIVSGYTISASVPIKDSNGGNSFAISEPGTYSFYAEGENIYTNPTFMVTIENNYVEKPNFGKTEKLLFNGKVQKFIPSSGFNNDNMVIFGNKETKIGSYNATIRLQWGKMWEDGTTDDIKINYKIIYPGLEIKNNSDYDYWFIDENYRRNYNNVYLHNYDDKELNKVDGVSRFVLGNISPNTTITAFLENLQSDKNLIKIYDLANILVYNGLISEKLQNDIFVSTGFKLELYKDTTNLMPYDTIYLSVLGDINGDGRITASDVSYLRQVANDSTLLESMPLERQLACMINNKGGITEVDSEILRNYIGKEIDLEKFMESETANTSNTYTYLTLDRDNMLRKTSESKTNVIGNISVNTSVEMLKTKLAEMGINISAMTIYNRKGEAVSDNSAIVGTGWRIEIGGEVTYLSVLGDLTGDGRITAADISYLRAIAASDTTNVQDCILLSAILLNKGGITTADSEVLKQSINKKTDINKY